MDGVPESLGYQRPAEFGIICHKYDYVRAVTHSSILWLRVANEKYKFPGLSLNKLIFVAYVLDILEAFMRILAKFLLMQNGTLKGVPGFTDQDLVPGDLILGMFSGTWKETFAD